MLITLLPRWMKRSLVMVSVSPSSAGAEAVSAWGRFTPMPDCIRGAVTMKITSRTSMTSMNGVTLISESDVPTRPRFDGEMGSTLRAIESFRDVEEFQGEILHLGDDVLDLVQEVVVGDDSG